MNDDNLNLQIQAYNKILYKIIHCEYSPGQKISQKMIEDDLHFGLTPIREALLRLRREGLIFVVPQSGTFVTKIDFNIAINARFIRESLEKNIISEAATLTSADFQEAHLSIKQQEKFVASKNYNGFFDEDEKFHKYFYIATNHLQTWNWIQAVNVQFNRFRWLRVRVTDLPWNLLIEQHKNILRAVESHSYERAIAESVQHLQLVFEEESAVIEKFPDFFENL
ncbi:GntR family transcriptional regulator [Lactococcus kimchii]|uniref:GntR family transcriptional regulator n=1 Tax=Lactococcus sp. S-13 TaxID=2507158 RepID=UPI001023DDF9|nr:GntR family transcriptional regulator [Lactococcus sp. S-13]RZI48344.1 GntR family transcriptional regulator [Lactococcus sp. S-13]